VPLATIHLDAVNASTTPIMIDSDKNSAKVYTANTGSNDFSIIKTLDNTEVLQTGAGVPPRITPPAGQTPRWVTVLP
jgi:hypothetical protein